MGAWDTGERAPEAGLGHGQIRRVTIGAACPTVRPGRPTDGDRHLQFRRQPLRDVLGRLDRGRTPDGTFKFGSLDELKVHSVGRRSRLVYLMSAESARNSSEPARSSHSNTAISVVTCNPPGGAVPERQPRCGERLVRRHPGRRPQILSLQSKSGLQHADA